MVFSGLLICCESSRISFGVRGFIVNDVVSKA